MEDNYITKNELKQLGQMLLIVSPLIILMFVALVYLGALDKGMSEREYMQLYIADNYYNMNTETRTELIEKYNFTPEDVNIKELMKEILTQ